LLLVDVPDEAVVRGCYTHRQLGRGLLLRGIPGVHVGVVLAHQLAVGALDLGHVGAGLEIEHAIPLGELGLGAAGPRAARAAGRRRPRRAGRRAAGRRRGRRPGAPALRGLLLHPAERVVGSLALLRLALVALAVNPGRALLRGLVALRARSRVAERGARETKQRQAADDAF